MTAPVRPGASLIALVLAAYAAAILLRMPEIVGKGRFWAEEGAIFFANAFQLDPAGALFLPYGGYLNLVANAAAVAARWTVPLSAAPYVTIGTGLLFQLLPPLILLTARDVWLRPWPIRLAGTALLLLVPGSDEIWLQSLHCQFELAIACGLLLALDVREGRGAVLSMLVLFLAPLCGPGAIALSPLFLSRALIERTTGRALHFAALAAGSACQLALFFTLGSDRGYTLDPALLLAVVTVKNLFVPFLGVGRAAAPALRLHDAVVDGHVPLLAWLAPLLVFGTIALVILRGANRPAFWLLAAAAAAALSAYIGALDGTVALLHARAGARYALVPNSLLALAILAIAGHRFLRWPAVVACVWLLLVGFQGFVRPWPPVADGPAWRPEVAHWRSDPSYAMKLWPYPWVLRLPPP